MNKLLCGKCLCGLLESYVHIHPQGRVRCAIDGQFRGKRVGCKLDPEQLMLAAQQLSDEASRKMGGS